MPCIPYTGQYISASLHRADPPNHVKLGTTYTESNQQSRRGYASAEVCIEFAAHVACSVNLYHLSFAKTEEEKRSTFYQHSLEVSLYENGIYRGRMKVEEQDLYRYHYNLVTLPIQIRNSGGQIEVRLRSLRTTKAGKENETLFKFCFHYVVSRFPRWNSVQVQGSSNMDRAKWSSSALFVLSHAKTSCVESAQRSGSSTPSRLVSPIGDIAVSSGRIESMGDTLRDPRRHDHDVRNFDRKEVAKVDDYLRQQLVPFEARRGSNEKPQQERYPAGISSCTRDSDIVMKISSAMNESLGSGGATKVSNDHRQSKQLIDEAFVRGKSTFAASDLTEGAGYESLQQELKSLEAEEEAVKRALLVSQIKRKRVAVELAHYQLEQEEKRIRRYQVDPRSLRISPARRISEEESMDSDGFEVIDVKKADRATYACYHS